VPYREVLVLVVVCGTGRVAGSVRVNSGPCGTGRPRPPARGGAGKYSTWSERSYPSTSTGRSARSQASRVTS
jgi:hypothetical protein